MVEMFSVFNLTMVQWLWIIIAAICIGFKDRYKFFYDACYTNYCSCFGGKESTGGYCLCF